MILNIKQIRAELKLTQQELAAGTGIPRDRIAKWEQGKGAPKAADEKKLLRFISNFEREEVPADSLSEKTEFYGQPGVTMVDSRADIKSYLEQRREQKNRTSQEAIPVYDVDVAASSPNLTLINDKNGEIPVDYLYVPEFAGCIAVNVYSDSMAPLLNPGSRMFIKKIEDWQDAMEPGQIYVVSLQDGRRFLKYVKRSSRPESHLLLVSHNTFYEDFEIPKRLVKSVWIVDGFMNKRTQSTFQFLKS